ncbi:DUF6304 family protein [Streptomyces sp. NPDC092369]|uniref:DUF6304 family protein n=1 Tax=Streptomyces sp. NPDC092369 TaxID=3366015 RepID=UPI003813F4FD
MTEPVYWPGRYTDRHGSEDVVFETDGRDVIRTTIRGVRFEGDTMDDLGALSGEPPERAFSFFDGGLCSCLLEWEVPVPVEVKGSGVRPAVLHCALRMGSPSADPRKGLDSETLTTRLHLDGYDYFNVAGQDDLEEALSEVQRQLPRAARLKACISCAWSDYSAGSHSLMGGLACFRDVKDRYRLVDGKKGPHGIFAIWPERTEFVQETWLCEEFEHRIGDRGYRGPFPYPRRP